MIFLPKIIDKLRDWRGKTDNNQIFIRSEIDAFINHLKTDYHYFDFGTLDNNKIIDIVDVAKDRFEHGLLKFPFENCAYQCNPMVDGVSDNSMIFINDKPNGSFVAFMIMERQIEIPIVFIEVLPEGIINIDTFKYFGKDGARYADKMVAGQSDIVDYANDLCIKAMGLTTLLNTRAAVSENQQADKEQNKMRIARGRVPFPDYNIVKINPLKTRAGSDIHSPGTPKRTHERRGHMRVYKNGKEIKIAPIIVNEKKGDLIPPGHYEVKL